jgi:hypothetical protein
MSDREYQAYLDSLSEMIDDQDNIANNGNMDSEQQNTESAESATSALPDTPAEVLFDPSGMSVEDIPDLPSREEEARSISPSSHFATSDRDIPTPGRGILDQIGNIDAETLRAVAIPPSELGQNSFFYNGSREGMEAVIGRGHYISINAAPFLTQDQRDRINVRTRGLHGRDRVDAFNAEVSRLQSTGLLGEISFTRDARAEGPHRDIMLDEVNRSRVERAQTAMNESEQASLDQREELARESRRQSRRSEREARADMFKTKILRIATQFCGSDNCSFEVWGGRNVLVIKWDYITIRNSRGATHDIKDLLLGLPIETTAFTGRMKGQRATISYIEYSSGYRHSHLPGHQWEPSDFCTGSDGINDVWSDLQMTAVDDENFDVKFEGFLHQMDSFVRYESIEGVPHIYIRNIREGSSNRYNIMNSDIRNMTTDILRYIPLDLVTFSYDVKESLVQLNESTELDKAMVQALDMSNRSYDDRMFSQRLPNGELISFQDDGISNYNGGTIGTVAFKDLRTIKIESLVENSDNNQVNKVKYINKNLRDEIFKKLEEIGSEKLERINKNAFVHSQNEGEGPVDNRRLFSSRHSLQSIPEIEA